MEPSPWSWDPAWVEVLVVGTVSLAYFLAARGYPASAARMTAFAAGQLLVLSVFVTPIGTLGLNYLLSAHLLQNVVLAEWAPALVVIGVPATLAAALARGRLIRIATHPLVALPAWLIAYGVWHVPAIYDAALRHPPLLHAEHASYFLTGLALWWPVFQDEPHRLPSGRRAAYVFAAFILASPIGLLLALLPSPIYAFYEEAPRIWGLSALEDQQIAGALMAGSEAVFFFGVFSAFVLRFFAEEGA